MAASKGDNPFSAKEGLIYDLRVVNIVAAHQMPFRISVEHILALIKQRKSSGHLQNDALSMIENCHYDPSIFPALRCVFHSKGGSALVYISGKIIITGIAQTSKIEKTFQKFIDLLTNFER